MTSPFDQFGNLAWPSTPTSPTSAPAGYTTPQQTPNIALRTPPLTPAQITSTQDGLWNSVFQQLIQAFTGFFTPTAGTPADQLQAWADDALQGVNAIEQIISSLLGLPTGTFNGLNEMLDALEQWGVQVFGGVQQILTWWNTLINGLLGSGSGGTGSVFDLTTWLSNAETNASAAWTQIEDFIATGSWSDLTAAWNDLLNALTGTSGSTVSNVSTIAAEWNAAVADVSNIFGAFSSGGTSAEFVTGVENLLAIVGLNSSTLGSATDLTALWTSIINDFINPLNAIEQSAISGLTDIWNWLTGTTTPTSTTQIQATAVSGTGGLADLVSAVEAGWDQLVQAFTGTGATGNSLGQLANAAAGTTSTAINANNVAQAAAMTQAQQVAAKAAWTAFGDVTADVTFPVGPTYSLSSMPTISVTSSNSAIGYIVTPDNVDKLSVLFVAETVGTVTGVYINVYSVGAAGLCTNVIAGSNIVSEIGTLEGVIYDDFSSALTVTPGDIWAVEVEITGSGSLTMMGLGSSWAPSNSAVSTGAVGGSRNTLQAPAYNTAGAGNTGEATSSVTVTESFTAPAGADIIVWATANARSAVMSISSLTATYGGTAMILEQSVNLEGVATDGQLAAFRLAGGGTGSAKTVSVTATASGAGATYLTIVPEAYENVGSIGTITTADGSSTAPSVAATGVSSGRVIGAISAQSPSVAPGISALNSAFTQRSLQDTSASYCSLITGDSGNTGALTFAATISTTSNWAAIAIVLEPGGGAVAPTTFTPTASTSIPLFGLSANGGTTRPVFAPETWSEYSHGSHTYSVPTWMVAGNHFDIAVLGAGQGGEGGGLTSGDWGDGGAAGSWTLRTLTYGTDIPTSTKTFSVTVGVGGTGGTPNAAGASGGSSTVTITGYGSSPITAAGGSSAEGLDGSWVGASPGNQTINDTYYGGGVQNSESSSGQSPGGGGGGGHGFAGSGGNGADAAVFIRAYQ